MVTSPVTELVEWARVTCHDGERLKRVPMVDQMVEVVPPGERERALASLELAFFDDPVMRWFWPDSDSYHQGFGGLVDAMASHAFAEGSAFAVEEMSGVALWVPPGFGLNEERMVEVMIATVRAELLGELVEFGDAIGRAHPSSPHWYLPVIGVRPAAQGRGLGSVLLAHAIATCDRDQLPAYLEASTPLNRQLYERFGFRATAEIQVGSSPPVWPMLREPHPAAGAEE